MSNDLGGDSHFIDPDRHLLATWPTAHRLGASLGSDPVYGFFTHHDKSDCVGILDLK